MSSTCADTPSPSPDPWRRPEPHEHRSPCPALNALANSGYVPRDGKVTSAQLVTALEKHLGISRSIAENLTNAAMRTLGQPGPDGARVLSLRALVLHGFIEHDASLTRRDAHKGDAAELAQPLLDQLVSCSRDGTTLTVEDLAVAHQLRMAQSAAGGHKVSLKAGVLGTAEAALLFCVLSRHGAIAIPDLIEFLQHERIPAHVPFKAIDRTQILSTAVRIAALGNLPFTEAAKRARKVIQERPEP